MEQDLIELYNKLVNLGMQYPDGTAYLADLEEMEAVFAHFLRFS